jgi:hypothetical protein
MKIVKLTLIGVTALVLAGPCIRAAAAHAGDHCIVYENKNFDGVTLGLTMNQSVPALPESIDNKISSVRVRQGCILVAFALFHNEFAQPPDLTHLSTPRLTLSPACSIG